MQGGVEHGDGRKIIEQQIETTGDPISVHLAANREILKADGKDVSVITVPFKAFLLETYQKPIQERLEHRSEIEQQYDNLLGQAQVEEPPPVNTGNKGKPRHTKGRNLLERVQKFKSAVLAFAFNEEVPFTNNQTERDIRPVKVKQKISGCFRTFIGAQQYARIAGFISTTRKHKLNVFKELCNAFEGYTFLTIEQTT